MGQEKAKLVVNTLIVLAVLAVGIPIVLYVWTYLSVTYINKVVLQPMADSMIQNAAKQNALALEKMAAQHQQQLDIQRAQRRADANGSRLARSCSDWKRADAQMHTYSTQKGVNNYCGRLEHYVETGQLLP